MVARPHRPRDTVSAGFVQGILAGFQYRPREAIELLNHAELAIDVHYDSSLRVPLAAYTRLYQLVSEHLADEGFGLFSRPLRPGCIAWMLHGLSPAATLGQALTRMTDFFNLLQDNLRLEWLDDSDQSALRFVVEQPLPVGDSGFVFAHEWLLRLIHGIAAWLVDDPLPLNSVEFPFPAPAHASEYERVFAQKVSFGGTALIAQFSPSAGQLPVRRDARAVDAFLRRMPGNITMLYRGEHEVAPRVRQQLRAAIPDPLNLLTIARQLHLSARTLHRRLEAEGTSLRRLRVSVRHELALEWLAHSQRPIQRIATDLGFADNTSFYRAFSQWEGCGPRAWREHQEIHAQSGSGSLVQLPGIPQPVESPIQTFLARPASTNIVSPGEPIVRGKP